MFLVTPVPSPAWTFFYRAPLLPRLSLLPRSPSLTHRRGWLHVLGWRHSLLPLFGIRCQYLLGFQVLHALIPLLFPLFCRWQGFVDRLLGFQAPRSSTWPASRKMVERWQKDGQGQQKDGRKMADWQKDGRLAERSEQVIGEAMTSRREKL